MPLPSSQINRSAPPGISKSDAKRRSRCASSRYGVNVGAQVRPSFFEYERRTSLACMLEPLLCSHCPTSVPFDRRTTEGTSIGLIDQSWPDATVRGSVQPVCVRSAKRSVVVEPACSIQLRSTPRLETVSCGSPALAAAGDTIAAIVGFHEDLS